jgi:hypothetical protein
VTGWIVKLATPSFDEGFSKLGTSAHVALVVRSAKTGGLSTPLRWYTASTVQNVSGSKWGRVMIVYGLDGGKAASPASPVAPPALIHNTETCKVALRGRGAGVLTCKIGRQDVGFWTAIPAGEGIGLGGGGGDDFGGGGGDFGGGGEGETALGEGETDPGEGDGLAGGDGFNEGETDPGEGVVGTGGVGFEAGGEGGWDTVGNFTEKGAEVLVTEPPEHTASTETE